MNALILQALPDARIHWQQWLQEVRQAANGVDPAKLVIVGHSLGVTRVLDFIGGRTVNPLIYLR